MICRHCGNEIASDAKFCGVCGAVNEATINGQPIEDTKPQNAQPVQPQYGQPAQPQYAQPAQPQYGQPAQPQYVQPAQPQYTQPVQTQYAQPAQYGASYNPAPDPVASGYAGRALGFGITSLCCCWLPFFFSIIGIVFGALAIKQSSNYSRVASVVSGRARTGRILGIIGLVISIIVTAFWILALFAGMA